MDSRLTKAHAILNELLLTPTPLSRRQELLRDLASIADLLGDDVVATMSMTVRRGMYPFEVLSGSRCSRTQIELPTSTLQSVTLGTPQVCGTCNRILVKNDETAALAATESL